MTNSRQVRRQVERQVAKASEQLFKARRRVLIIGTGRRDEDTCRSRLGISKDASVRHLSYPPHFDRIASPSAIEEAILHQGIML